MGRTYEASKWTGIAVGLGAGVLLFADLRGACVWGPESVVDRDVSRGGVGFEGISVVGGCVTDSLFLETRLRAAVSLIITTLRIAGP